MAVCGEKVSVLAIRSQNSALSDSFFEFLGAIMFERDDIREWTLNERLRNIEVTDAFFPWTVTNMMHIVFVNKTGLLLSKHIVYP